MAEGKQASEPSPVIGATAPASSVSAVVAVPSPFAMSPTLGELQGALAKARGSMSQPKMSGRNSAYQKSGGGSAYSTLTDVMEASSDALAKNDVSVLQCPLPGTSPTDTVVVTHVGHKSGEWMQFTSRVRADREGIHGWASAVTYLRRIALASVLGLAGELDDDGNAAANKSDYAGTKGSKSKPKPAPENKAPAPMKGF